MNYLCFLIIRKFNLSQTDNPSLVLYIYLLLSPHFPSYIDWDTSRPIPLKYNWCLNIHKIFFRLFFYNFSFVVWTWNSEIKDYSISRTRLCVMSVYVYVFVYFSACVRVHRWVYKYARARSCARVCVLAWGYSNDTCCGVHIDCWDLIMSALPWLLNFSAVVFLLQWCWLSLSHPHCTSITCGSDLRWLGLMVQRRMKR